MSCSAMPDPSTISQFQFHCPTSRAEIHTEQMFAVSCLGWGRLRLAGGWLAAVCPLDGSWWEFVPILQELVSTCLDSQHVSHDDFGPSRLIEHRFRDQIRYDTNCAWVESLLAWQLLWDWQLPHLSPSLYKACTIASDLADSHIQSLNIRVQTRSRFHHHQLASALYIFWIRYTKRPSSFRTIHRQYVRVPTWSTTSTTHSLRIYQSFTLNHTHIQSQKLHNYALHHLLRPSGCLCLFSDRNDVVAGRSR